MSEIKGVAKLNRIMFPKGRTITDGGFTIATFEPISIEKGSVELHEMYKTFTIKGEMPSLKQGEEYNFVCTEGERHPQFGISYELLFMRNNIQIVEGDEESVKSMLKIILTDKQLAELYKVTDNPLQLVKDNDIQGLMQANGIGEKTAKRIVDLYDSQKDYSFAYIELGKYDISPQVIKKITDFFKSPELAVQKTLENPYLLMKLGGWGFKKCDQLYIKMGNDLNSELRIKTFLTFALNNEASNGNTWISLSDLVKLTMEYIPQAEKIVIGKTLLSNPTIFSLSEDRMKVSLKHYNELERGVANELIRLITASNDFEYDGWMDIVAKVENGQGWEFTSQQKDDAMKTMLDNNVSIIEGLGGTGKTTSLKAVLDILEKRGYTYIQGAISGKASNNLAIVTGRDGSTIARMLGMSPMSGKYIYNSSNKLPYDIIIIDEISMVDIDTFYHLLMAIRSGCKLIMLGDSEQLEAIGVSVLKDLVDSEIVPRVMLTEIHRQAKKSAIVVHSIDIRYGKNPVKNVVGRTVYGELEDLDYELVEDDDDIYALTVREFYKSLKAHDVQDIQILCASKFKGSANCYSINKACQKIYNPPAADKDEFVVGNLDTNGYILRKGDKVINVKNQYQAEDESGAVSPIFNGNIGILEDFKKDEDGDEYMLINFEGIDERIKVQVSDADSIELAYCITIHKAQGMSIPVVIVAFPFNYMLNSKQLLYTAMTRAKEKCVIIGMHKTIGRAIQKNNVLNKKTYLKDYLKSLKQKACNSMSKLI